MKSSPLWCCNFEYNCFFVFCGCFQSFFFQVSDSETITLFWCCIRCAFYAFHVLWIQCEAKINFMNWNLIQFVWKIPKIFKNIVLNFENNEITVSMSKNNVIIQFQRNHQKISFFSIFKIKLFASLHNGQRERKKYSHTNPTKIFKFCVPQSVVCGGYLRLMNMRLCMNSFGILFLQLNSASSGTFLMGSFVLGKII